jgi:peptidoglycan hydrolase CwlO-like protein
MSNLFPLIFINSITTTVTTLAITYLYNLYIINDQTIKEQNIRIEYLSKHLQEMLNYIEEVEEKIDKKHIKFIESNNDLNSKLDEFITSNYDIYD